MFVEARTLASFITQRLESAHRDLEDRIEAFDLNRRALEELGILDELSAAHKIIKARIDGKATLFESSRPTIVEKTESRPIIQRGPTASVSLVWQDGGTHQLKIYVRDRGKTLEVFRDNETTTLNIQDGVGDKETIRMAIIKQAKLNFTNS